KCGITHFCVAQYEEAIQLQKIADLKHCVIEILIFGYIPYTSNMIIPDNWHITISDFESLNRIIKEIKTSINIQIKIDTGMNRKGFKTKSDFQKAYTLAKTCKKIKTTGCYTHFS